MSTATAFGMFAFMCGLLALTFLTAGVIHIIRDWSEDRKREAAYAAEWQRRHDLNQRMGRYGYETHRYHYDEPERPL